VAAQFGADGELRAFSDLSIVGVLLMAARQPADIIKPQQGWQLHFLRAGIFLRGLCRNCSGFSAISRRQSPKRTRAV